MEPTECSETSSFNIQAPGKYPKEDLSYLQHGESLKTINERCLEYTVRNIVKSLILLGQRDVG
jgi:bisphosphoglycerate-dependent phosphoglycerate mutase